MDRLGQILGRVVGSQPGGEKLRSAQIRQAFLTILGESLAREIDTCEMRAGVLHVSTSNPSLAHQLSSDKDHLLQVLNHGSGGGIKQLRVRTGRGPG
ncbi:MAG TPA: DUF721 domain-containing protein [Candidatus Nitrosotalea sp.]|nr:DUF721 domain-containing protein [Candidatus Nitrosotalea sp.]